MRLPHQPGSRQRGTCIWPAAMSCFEDLQTKVGDLSGAPSDRPLYSADGSADWLEAGLKCKTHKSSATRPLASSDLEAKAVKGTCGSPVGEVQRSFNDK